MYVYIAKVSGPQLLQSTPSNVLAFAFLLPFAAAPPASGMIDVEQQFHMTTTLLISRAGSIPPSSTTMRNV
jgi:hypothetical protein